MTLARCPLCGSEAAVKRRSVDGHYMYRVECSSVGTDEMCHLVTLFFDNKDEAIHAWVQMAGEVEDVEGEG